ncbi:MAG: hypothetical protein ABSB75_02805 [Candidatus Limnocylindrales bacterium]
MSTLYRHGVHAADRLELELAAWLAEFEPAATPVALRLRTYADLRDEAVRRRPVFAWLRPALSLAGSLFAIGGTAFALMALVALGGAVDRSGMGGGGQPGTGEPTSSGSYALMSLIVAAVGVLAGASLYLRFLRRSFVRLAFGASTVTPGALLSLRRPWRSVGWGQLALAALTLVTAILAIQDALASGLVQGEMADLLLLDLGMAPFALAIVWRYPLSDRPTRLLLAGALLSLVYLWTGYALFWIPSLWSLMDPQIWELLALYLLPMAAQVVLVAGLAARLNLRAGPPIALAALFVALGFMQTRFPIAASPDATMPLLTQLLWIVEGLNQWLLLLAWLAAAWIGFAGFRRTRSRSWLIVLAAGAIGASGYGGVYLTWTGTFVDFGPYTGTWIALLDLSTAWYHLAMALAELGLLAALIAGLRPVGAPAPHTKASKDATPASLVEEPNASPAG